MPIPLPTTPVPPPPPLPPPPPVPPPAPAPELDALADVPPPPPLVPVTGQFDTAAAALHFAGQLGGEVHYGRSTDGAWWVGTEAPLAVTREQIAAVRGTTFVDVDGALVRDRGWGDDPPDPAADGSAAAEIDNIGLVALVRVAGLTASQLPAPDEISVLVPRAQMQRIVARALDLQLAVRYRAVGLRPLFAGTGGTTDAECVSFELRLRATTGQLPASLLAALDEDPELLACRPISPRLLIQHPLTSPLPDVRLAELAQADPTDGIWVLAGRGRPCARLRPHAEFCDAAELVRLVDHHVVDLEPGAPDADHDPVPPAPALRLVPTRTRGIDVAAVLLDDKDLALLPALLEGRPLAETALVVRGRDRHLLLPPRHGGDRHLLLAPGGLLERLPVGELLDCIGPGLIYVPLGYRLQPRLPERARRALFRPDATCAVVLQPDGVTLRFSIAAPEPVWSLWAGPPPRVDHQLSLDAQGALTELEERLTPATPAPATPPSPNDTVRPLPVTSKRTWLDDALELEAAGNLEDAALLHEQHQRFLQAAHLYERAAREGAGTP